MIQLCTVITAFCAVSLCVSAAAGIPTQAAAGIVLQPMTPAFWFFAALALLRQQATVSQSAPPAPIFKMDREQCPAESLFQVTLTEPKLEKNAVNITLQEPPGKEDKDKKGISPSHSSINDRHRSEYSYSRNGRNGQSRDETLRERMMRERNRGRSGDDF